VPIKSHSFAVMEQANTRDVRMAWSATHWKYITPPSRMNARVDR